MKYFRKVKKTKNNLAILNIGCGSRTHWEWNNVDFSPYARLAHHRQLAKFLHAVGILSDFRYENVLTVDSDIIHWDISQGIPFEDNIFDAVYHSHFITHVDRDVATFIMRECYRTLKLGGVIRVVVPDLLWIVRMYNKAIEEIVDGSSGGQAKHEKALNELFELMVRKNPVGTSKQNCIVHLIERIARGGINCRGELRRWHYDQYSMGVMLYEVGFPNTFVTGPSESRIEGWDHFNLDLNEDGSVYKPGSLYMEGIK